MGGHICRLCKENSELMHSHILPEFFYLGLYDDLHRTLAISQDAEKAIQKGIREHLLCQKCETKLSSYEGYAAKLIRDISNFHRDTTGRFLYSDGTDYLRFKLFQLSLIWRASVAENPAFAQVNLGPHEEIVRRMLYEEIPGKTSEYGCIMMSMLDTELIHKILSSPTRVRPRPFGHTAYRFMTGRLTWLFFVTSHPVSAEVQEFFLQETGLLRIWLARDEKPLLMSIAKNLHRLERGR